MKLRIALNSDVIQDGAKQRVAVPLPYIQMLESFDIQPLILPPSLGISSLLDHVDGLILIGGDDYLIGNNGAPPKNFCAIPPRRESCDIELATYALKSKLPVLGICAGFQLLTLLSGGSIFGDLSEGENFSAHKLEAKSAGAELANTCTSKAAADNSKADNAKAESISGELPPPLAPLMQHEVSWQCPDALRKELGIDLADGIYTTNSHHHQAANQLAENWQQLATTEDGCIEAAASKDSFALGLQWHPERDYGSDINQAILRAFFAACKSHQLKSIMQ